MTTIARYDGVADYYASGWGEDLSDPVSVSLFELLADITGQQVLDVACGHGRISRGLARQGASVTAVDVSAAMLGKAEEFERNDPLGIRYVQADAASPGLLEGDRYDAAACSMGLADIDDLDGTLSNLRRLLRPGGTFAFTMLHPCFPGIEGVSAAWPSDGTYYDERYWQADASLSTLRRQVGANHRTLSTYLNTLHHHGFTLTRTAEPQPRIDPDSPRHPMTKYPVFLVATASSSSGQFQR
jgi:2-polyprenyl-3-methyl-5-hydroxy-6-metoxy-1,4-benzoquinol methylase